jgi:hypothetical protein
MRRVLGGKGGPLRKRCAKWKHPQESVRWVEESSDEQGSFGWTTLGMNSARMNSTRMEESSDEQYSLWTVLGWTVPDGEQYPWGASSVKMLGREMFSWMNSARMNSLGWTVTPWTVIRVKFMFACFLVRFSYPREKELFFKYFRVKSDPRIKRCPGRDRSFGQVKSSERPSYIRFILLLHMIRQLLNHP